MEMDSIVAIVLVVGVGLLAFLVWIIERLLHIGDFQRRIQALEKEVARLQKPALPQSQAPAPAPVLVSVPDVPNPTPCPVPQIVPPVVTVVKAPAPLVEQKPTLIAAEPITHKTPPLTVPQVSSEDKPWKGFQTLLGKNPVVVVGLVVFLFGVTFLIRLASQAGLFPPEARLLCAALLGIALLIPGYRLRAKMPHFAMPLQGGAIGVLFLVVFAAHRVYHLIPPAAALPMAVVVLALTCLLAVQQSSLVLAYLGLATGFAAPIALSTGEGNHIGLFTYYALLDTGIFAIAWYRSWRSLHLTAFLATYVVATTWGIMKFEPEHFASCEAFLWIFYVLFSSTALVFARREYRGIAGYVDGTLVFGLPIATFALQSGLVTHDAMKLAWTSAILAFHQLGLGLWLWRQIRIHKQEHLRPMAETLAALGVLFASLAIPLAFSAQWTTLLWCFEGLGLLWIALRQNRLWTFIFGFLLLLMGTGIELTRDHLQIPTALGTLLATWLGAWLCQTRISTLAKTFRQQVVPIILLVLSWILAAHACYLQVDAWNFETITMLRAFTSLFLGIQFVLWIAGQRLRWELSAWPWLVTSVLWVWALLGDVAQQANNISMDFTQPWGAVAFVGGWVLLAISLVTLFIRNSLTAQIRFAMHCILLYTLLIILVVQGHSWLLMLGKGWWVPLLAGGLALSLWGIPRSPWLAKPFWRESQSLYEGPGLLPLAMVLAFFCILSLFSDGSAWTLTWFPLLNPIDLAAWMALLAVAFLPTRTWSEISLPAPRKDLMLVTFLLAWIGSTLDRAFSHWGGVEWSWVGLWDCHALQSAWSLLLTLQALALMWTATHKHIRKAWIAGAILLAITIAKLFLVDLSGQGTVTRIVSFLGVGLLMVAIGYFSPLPPRLENKP